MFFNYCLPNKTLFNDSLLQVYAMIISSPLYPVSSISYLQKKQLDQDYYLANGYTTQTILFHLNRK